MATARVSRPATARRAQQTQLRTSREPGTRHLEVVRPRRRRLHITPRTGVVLTVALFAALFVVAVSHALLIEGQRHLEQLDAEAARQGAENYELRRQVAELESPARIVSEAQDRLGMVPADDVEYLTPDGPPPAAGDTAAGEGGSDSPATSYAEVKPYLEPTR